MRSALLSFLVLATAIFAAGPAARAQDAAVTMSLDRVHLLVNDQLGDERWSISMNLSAKDPSKVVSVTGNAYRSDGSAVSFVHCAVRPGSEGTLSDPSSTFHFTCRGTNGCDDTALACARTGWTSIGRDVQIPASFFLPPDGLGSVDDAGADTVGTRVARLLASLWQRVQGSIVSMSPRDAVAQTSEIAAATMTPDLLSHLVVRDRSGQRWSIAYNVVRDDTRAGGFKATSVTGIIYGADAAPAFVYCVPRSGSVATLEDPSAELHFVCFGTTACTTTAEACATTQSWTQITDDAVIAASFFLPDKGRGTPPSSDDNMIFLGNDVKVPGIASEEYKGSGSGSCDEGAACIVDRIGGCEDVRGRLTEVDGVCRCYVAPLSPYCLRTGTESTARIPAACGDACSFQVGVPEEGAGLLRIARGVSLPFEIDSPNCYCYANPPGRLRTVQVCGGVDDDPCAEDRCCVDDPRDGCDPLAGDAGCSGICVVPSESTAPDAPHCAKRTVADQFCGDGGISGSEICDPGISPAQTCASLSFSEGTLDCSGCIPVGCSDGDEPPQITSIDELPPTIDTYARHPVRGTFSDADGDVVAAIVTNGSQEITYDVSAAGRRSGTFEVFVTCNGVTGDAGKVDFTVDLVDAAENKTEESETITSACVVPPLCGDGKKEGAEQCDPGSDDPADACTDDRACVNDCTCRKANSCAGRCCPELDGFCGHEELDCRCDMHCRDADRNDCCNDAQEECGL